MKSYVRHSALLAESETSEPNDPMGMRQWHDQAYQMKQKACALLSLSACQSALCTRLNSGTSQLSPGFMGMSLSLPEAPGRDDLPGKREAETRYAYNIPGFVVLAIMRPTQKLCPFPPAGHQHKVFTPAVIRIHALVPAGNGFCF